MKSTRRKFLKVLSVATLAPLGMALPGLGGTSPDQSVGTQSSVGQFGYPYRLKWHTFGPDRMSDLFLIESGDIHSLGVSAGNGPLSVQVTPASTNDDPGRLRVTIFEQIGKSEVREIATSFASLSNPYVPGITEVEYPELALELKISDVKQ